MDNDTLFEIHVYKGYQLEPDIDLGVWKAYVWSEWFWDTLADGFSTLDEAKAYIDVICRLDQPELTRDHIELLRITTGANLNCSPETWGDRNKFFLRTFSAVADEIDYLRHFGYMAITQRYQNGILFHATEKGLKAIGFNQSQINRAMHDL